MRETDIAIVGAGLAGALCATMLGRAGYTATLIDPFCLNPVAWPVSPSSRR